MTTTKNSDELNEALAACTQAQRNFEDAEDHLRRLEHRVWLLQQKQIPDPDPARLIKEIIAMKPEELEDVVLVRIGHPPQIFKRSKNMRPWGTTFHFLIVTDKANGCGFTMDNKRKRLAFDGYEYCTLKNLREYRKEAAAALEAYAAALEHLEANADLPQC